MRKQQQHVRRNPDPIRELLGLALIGVSGYGLYLAAKTLGPANPAAPAAPAAGKPAAAPAAPAPAAPPPPAAQQPAGPAPTQLTLDIAPTSPPAQTGAVVAFWGRLTGPSGPLAGASIALVDPDKGDTEYQWAITNDNGDYRMERPLHVEEVTGYRIFARFNGKPGFAPYRTGIWKITPAPLSAGDPNTPA